MLQFFIYLMARFFVANSSFNNLGKPLYSTVLSIGRATVGTLPFVYFGAVGVLYGQALGTIVFGLLGLVVLQRHVSELISEAEKSKASEVDLEEDLPPMCLNTQAFCIHDAVSIDDIAKQSNVLDQEAQLSTEKR